jgi:E3 ubiquitin-protein ligase MARCH5
METDCDGRDMSEVVLGDIGKESRILVEEPLDSASRALGRLMEEPVRLSSSLSSDEPAASATITSSSSMELDLSERERVAELARLDKESMDNLESLVLGVASKRGVTLRGEEAFSGEGHGNSYSPEWSPEDEAAEEEEDDDGEEERLLRPRFEDEEVCLSDAETLGSNGSDELTDYENSGIVEQQRNGAGGGEEERQCWVCFASEEDDPVAAWVHPCLCKGTTKWVHQVCIQRWVDEKQKGNNSTGVVCPQCGADYIIQFPASPPFLRLLDALDKLVGRLCPVVAGGVCVGSLYWTCVTYGAVTVMQVAGHSDGLTLMENSDPLLLLVSLPLVPLGLVLGKMVKWQEPVLHFLRAHLPHLQITRYILPAFASTPQSEGSSSAASLPPSSDPVSVTRTFCGALFFPTIATFLGSTLFEEVQSPLKRAAMGGFCFVGAKGVLKIYHKQNQYIRQCKRQILDYHLP